jgi:drug/metabolite transporter (DMT)-like permease
MTQKTLSAAAWAGLLGLALMWGGSFLAIAVALREMPVLTLVALRVSIAALALWVVVLVTGQPIPRAARGWTGIAGMGLVGNVMPFTLIAWGQQHIPSGLAAILNASTAIFSVLVAALVLADERLTARRAVGVVLGFAGVATAIGLDNLTRLDPGSLGQWALIGAALCYAVSGVWGRVMLRGVPPLVSAAGMLTVSAVVMIPAALLHDGTPHLDYTPQTLAAIGYLSLIASALAYLVFYRVLTIAGAGNVSLVTLLVAPVAILLGALVLDEALPAQALAGFVLLALGLVVLDGRLGRRSQGSGPTKVIP